MLHMCNAAGVERSSSTALGVTMPGWDALAPRRRPVARSWMSIFELAILAMILVGFLGLIVYVAKHARSGDK